MSFSAHTTARTQKRQVRVLKSKYSRYFLSGSTRKLVMTAAKNAMTITAFFLMKPVDLFFIIPSFSNWINLLQLKIQLIISQQIYMSIFYFHYYIIIFACWSPAEYSADAVWCKRLKCKAGFADIPPSFYIEKSTLSDAFWCSRQGLNLHTFRQWILNPSCLPVPPRERRYQIVYHEQIDLSIKANTIRNF